MLSKPEYLSKHATARIKTEIKSGSINSFEEHVLQINSSDITSCYSDCVREYPGPHGFILMADSRDKNVLSSEFYCIMEMVCPLESFVDRYLVQSDLADIPLVILANNQDTAANNEGEDEE